ncbi:ArgS-related anticodon-binding protein NrtL [Streptomyces sp. NPDC029554]|uniref:ArgS-related anticodon-binding protein NrtL n=1 Tax=Streptomyces sp. NPDC029554 TaxID=3155126 RepID=UPI0033E6DE3E
MTPVELSRTVLHAVRRAVDEGELSVTVPERVVVAPPGPGGCGDYATNIALQLARAAGQPPRHVAEILRVRLLQQHGVSDVVVTGPGFLNLSLEGTATADLVGEILSRGRRYGHAPRYSGTHVRLRCPAEVRAVVFADAIARLRRSQGDVVRVHHDGQLPQQWTTVLGVGTDDLSEPPGLVDGDGDDGDDGTDGDNIDDTEDSRESPGLDGTDDINGTDCIDGIDRTDCTEDSQESRPPVDVVDRTVRPLPAPADPLPLGRDAGRWALLHPAPHDRPRITREHLVQRETNPLFRVRYAHARTRALLRNAADLGFRPEPGPVALPRDAATPGIRPEPAPALDQGPHPAPALDQGPDPAPAREAAATTLLALLGDHPRILVAAQDAPDRLARHLVAVADATLPLLPAVLPLGEEKPSAAHRARLALAEAAGTVLAGGLSLLGIDAPEHL